MVVGDIHIMKIWIIAILNENALKGYFVFDSMSDIGQKRNE